MFLTILQIKCKLQHQKQIRKLANLCFREQEMFKAKTSHLQCYKLELLSFNFIQTLPRGRFVGSALGRESALRILVVLRHVLS